MKTLYEAGSALEAHMLVDLLKQEGLCAQIQGEHLQGAIGELPAAGLVRLVISPQEFDAARQVIARWESSQPRDHTPKPTAPSKGTHRLGYLCAGVVLGVAAAYAFVRTPVETDGIDHNGDGLLDERWTYSARGAALTFEADRNLDHKIDLIQSYDDKGLVSHSQSDDDFDGTFETHITYVMGNTETVKTDTDHDGFADLMSFYKHGVLRTTEYRAPSTGLARRVEHFTLGRVTHADLDSNGDGRLDTRITFDALGGEVAQTAIP